MKYKKAFHLLIVVLLLAACRQNETKQSEKVKIKDTLIIDCNYTFDEAIDGTKAPKNVIDELSLVTVHYYSMDGKVHQGQLLVHNKIADEVRGIFREILLLKFPVQQVIPVVKYNWDDKLSMKNNNSYGFCYRDISYSKHALGLAIDINPQQNPNRWKPEFSYRKDVPEGAVYNPKAPGTFYPNHPVVEIFRNKGYFWGHNFRRNHDDHHFEKK